MFFEGIANPIPSALPPETFEEITPTSLHVSRLNKAPPLFPGEIAMFNWSNSIPS